MMLTPLTRPQVPKLLSNFSKVLKDGTLEKAVFTRIAKTLQWIRGSSLALSQCTHHRKDAIDLAKKFGMNVSDQSPNDGFTWDGWTLSTNMEPSVIIHDVAHFQVCTPQRRRVLDFGLGAGPETGNRAQADAQAQVHGVDRDIEEALASLLGILWEVELKQPAILAFLEQNWLEGGATGANQQHLQKTLRTLYDIGVIDRTGRPRYALRTVEHIRSHSESFSTASFVMVSIST